jgi:hypothetical protein
MAICLVIDNVLVDRKVRDLDTLNSTRVIIGCAYILFICSQKHRSWKCI